MKMIAGKTLEEWREFARRDDCLTCGSMVPSDLRELVAAIPDPDSGFHKLDNAKQVFFYEQEFYALSNFSAFTLQWRGLRFDTSEAAYHYQKFTGYWGHGTQHWYRHQEISEEIRRARSAHDAFKIAEREKSSRRPDWDLIKTSVMLEVLRAKAAQHEYVRRKLLETGDRELIEDSWRDDYWGWGPNRDGQNMLGKLWMEVRAEIRSAA